MPSVADRFLALGSGFRKAVHVDLCRDALRVWEKYCQEHENLDYVETVCGTKQSVDRSLPEAAIRSAIACRDVEDVATRYQEPIVAMQDDDLEFPDDVELAYYSIYNLFNRYVSCRLDDDWLIVNQALSAQGEDSDYAAILESAIERVGEPADSPDADSAGDP